MDQRLYSQELFTLDNTKLHKNRTIVYQGESTAHKKIRFLDAKNHNNSVCMLAAEIIPEKENFWQLTLHINAMDESGINKIYNIGTYEGILTDSTYPLGASLVKCRSDINELTEVVVAKQSVNNQYQIEKLYIDMSIGEISTTELLYESESLLYRPIIKENRLMFIEARFWRSYTDWRANQKLMRLN
jgi:hypothetical protein